MTAAGTRPRIAPDIVWRLLENNAVLVSPREGEVRVLNPVRTAIWQRLLQEEALPEIEKLENEVERIKLRKVVADTIGIIYTDAILKIAHQYPDLNPYV